MSNPGNYCKIRLPIWSVQTWYYFWKQEKFVLFCILNNKIFEILAYFYWLFIIKLRKEALRCLEKQIITQCWLIFQNNKSISCLLFQDDSQWLQNHCMKMGDAYIIVYSVTDKVSFEKASELRIQLRRARQTEDIPIILVGNKSDLVRSREVSVDGKRHWILQVLSKVAAKAMQDRGQ